MLAGADLLFLTKSTSPVPSFTHCLCPLHLPQLANCCNPDFWLCLGGDFSVEATVQTLLLIYYSLMLKTLAFIPWEMPLLLQIRQKLCPGGNQKGFMLNKSSTLLSQKFHELYCQFDFWKPLVKLIYFLIWTIRHYDHFTFPSLPTGFLQLRARDYCLIALTANKLVSSLPFFEQGWQHETL